MSDRDPGARAPSATEIRRAAKRVRAELERHGLLLTHDAALPSATRLLAGQPVRGSWWGHPAGKLIYEALGSLGDDVVRVKLVAGKNTLVYRKLWPALIAAARSGRAWQSAGLDDDARALLRRVRREGRVRTDEPRSEGRKLGRAATELEQRLLVRSVSEHTASGHHARFLTSFEHWQREVGISDSELPSADDAISALTAPVRAWAGDRADGLLPWLPRRSVRAPRNR